MTSATLLPLLTLAESTAGTRFVLIALAIIPGMTIIVCARAISRWLEHHTEK